VDRSKKAKKPHCVLKNGTVEEIKFINGVRS